MKKHSRILLSLLVFVLVATLGTSTIFADTEETSNIQAVKTTAVPVKTISTSAVSVPSYSGQLNAGSDSKYILYPVTAKATGKMYLDVRTPNTNTSYVEGTIGKYSNGYYTHSTSYCYPAPGTSDTGRVGFDVVKGKKYYVGLKCYNPGQTAQVRTYIVPYANNRLLKEQKSFLIGSGQKGDNYNASAIYYKVKPTKTGVMTVTLKEYGTTSTTGYVTLYNADKKVRSEKLWYTGDNKVRFGVKKGKTYYLKVQGIYGYSSECYKYGIKYSISEAKDRSLSKKANAKTLKRKATATATLFTANGKTETDWYKFKVTSKRKTVISVDATKMRGSDQKLTITVYKGSKKVDSATLYPGTYGKQSYTITYGKTYGKANSGTYYVKVTKTSKLSGKYKIRYVR